MKFINKKKILHYIQKNPGRSRTEISKALSISKPTISKLVDELINEGWFREKESSSSSPSGGRRAFQIYFNHNAKYIVGVDIGGTSVEMAVMNLKGDFKEKVVLSTQEHLSKDLVQIIADNINSLITKSSLENSQIIGAGIGVPGITDVEKGIVFDAPSLGWKHYHLVEKLDNLLPFPVYVDNDVNVAALGEQWKGAGKDKRNILQITLGTGVGCGMIINGQLYRGSSFAAGEIGYMVTDKHAAEEAYDSIFSGYGFLDSHIGGPSITKRMLKHLRTGDEESDDWPAKRIFESAIAGDKNALNIVDDALSHLAFALINVISIVNPECVIIGGGLSKSMHHFLPEIMSTIDKHLPIETSVTITKLDNVSVLGAAYLVLKEHESILQV
ncbi:ROK family transcriptional regulator [Sporosarcina sp. Marseille-Q4063]|uniref:ROK family transcriptional regulator n=1 Tax=Sporosarcina sp. Marseille-Q4063 TaxID=2810514 RepID=UPI001BAFFF34|nr:ROK family transcriptional regulator [Sporosarcina sp. Marseille-Q4063]QUW22824.1 ROK family transcriptional regulator [Sporosarcina sp. Marseille-Q4063]